MIIQGFHTHCFFFGLLFVLNTHAMTHYFNEYYDFEADCNNQNPSPWTGGSRVLVNKDLAPRASLISERISLIFSLIFLVFSPSLISLAIGLMIVFLAWGYSAPPLKLEYRGLGELCVAVVLNLLVPLWGYTLQRNSLHFSPLLLLLVPLALIEYARMMVMNMPDRASDALSGKKTLIVRIGMKSAVKIYIFVNVLAYLSLFFFCGLVPNSLILCLLGSFPLCLWLIYRFLRGDWKSSKKMYYIPFLASTHNGLVCALFLLGLIISSSRPIPVYALECWPLFLYFFSVLYFSLRVIKTPAKLRIEGDR